MRCSVALANCKFSDKPSFAQIALNFPLRSSIMSCILLSCAGMHSITYLQTGLSRPHKCRKGELSIASGEASRLFPDWLTLGSSSGNFLAMSCMVASCFSTLSSKPGCFCCNSRNACVVRCAVGLTIASSSSIIVKRQARRRYTSPHRTRHTFPPLSQSPSPFVHPTLFPPGDLPPSRLCEKPS